MTRITTRIVCLSLLLAGGCGQGIETTSREGTDIADRPAPVAAEEPDLSRLLKKGLSEREVYKILEVTSVSAGPVLTVHALNHRYRTRKFPLKVVNVEYSRTPTDVTLVSWELTDEASYDSFTPVADWQE
jgi:hypothetical protein